MVMQQIWGNVDAIYVVNKISKFEWTILQDQNRFLSLNCEILMPRQMLVQFPTIIPIP